MNQRTICANVYPEGIQPIKGNNCGLIPLMVTARKFIKNVDHARKFCADNCVIYRDGLFLTENYIENKCHTFSLFEFQVASHIKFERS